jgi:gliding motility-associated lipoprotein GldD
MPQRFLSSHLPLAFASLFLTAFLWAACEGYTPVPKPRAYPRVVYPDKIYRPFDAGYCPFLFEMPAYATIEKDTSYFDERPKNECWFNLDVPQLNAKIYCSYYPVSNRKNFDELVSDAFSITNKHNIRASYIEEIPVHRPDNRVYGVVFHVEGAAASSYQFFLTDSTRHFLRGALYFHAQTKPDSLAPVVAFMKKDLEKLVQTLAWK